jgi:ABC-type branched-subunit amino acid transport system substrate-binding protein
MNWKLGFSCLMFAALIASVGCKAKKTDGPTATSKKVAIVGGDGVMNQQFIEVGGSAVEGSYVITPYINDESIDKAIGVFSKSFTKKFKKEPDAWAALTYDAVGTYAKIMLKVGPDRQKIRDELAGMNTKSKGYSGVTGVTYFDQNGDSVKPLLIAIVKNKKLVKSDIQLGPIKGEGNAAVAKTGQKANGKPIYIGVCGPFTGQNQAFGEMIEMGAKLKIEEINAAGGIKGRPLVAKWGDDEGVNSKASNVAKGLALDKDVVAIVGHFNSTCSLAAKPIYTDNKVPMLSPGSTNVDVCKGSDWIFRNLYRDDTQGAAAATFIKEKLGRKRVVVFYDNDDYGGGLKKFFVNAAKEIGLEVLESIEYNRESTTDFASLVTKAKYKKPDAIFIAGLYGEAALIAKAAKKAGIIK